MQTILQASQYATYISAFNYPSTLLHVPPPSPLPGFCGRSCARVVVVVVLTVAGDETAQPNRGRTTCTRRSRGRTGAAAHPIKCNETNPRLHFCFSGLGNNPYFCFSSPGKFQVTHTSVFQVPANYSVTAVVCCCWW